MVGLADLFTVPSNATYYGLFWIVKRLLRETGLLLFDVIKRVT